MLAQIQSAGDACYLDTRGTARLKKTYYRHCNQLDTALEGGYLHYEGEARAAFHG